MSRITEILAEKSYGRGIDIVRDLLTSADSCVAQQGVIAFHELDMSCEVINSCWKGINKSERAALAGILLERNAVPLSMVGLLVSDPNDKFMATSAMKICENCIDKMGAGIPAHIIEPCLRSQDDDVRYAAEQVLFKTSGVEYKDKLYMPTDQGFAYTCERLHGFNNDGLAFDWSLLSGLSTDPTEIRFLARSLYRRYDRVPIEIVQTGLWDEDRLIRGQAYTLARYILMKDITDTSPWCRPEPFVGYLHTNTGTVVAVIPKGTIFLRGYHHNWASSAKVMEVKGDLDMGITPDGRIYVLGDEIVAKDFNLDDWFPFRVTETA
jgi:hypothetical protein